MMIKAILAGAIMLAAVVIAMFFWEFWRKSGDRLFKYFSIAFFLLGIERLSIELWPNFESYVYLIRLLAFMLIVVAILDKNRSGKPGQDQP